jgi:hypothetical protein
MKRNDKQHPDYEPVWSEDQCRNELEKAKRVRPSSLSDADLFRLLRGLHIDFLVHFWADVRPFFVEFWRRIENKQIADIPTKSEACRLLGLSLRWAERIVSGTAKKKAVNRESLDISAPPPHLFTNEEYATDIAGYASRQLQPLAAPHPKRYQHICRSLAEHFDRLRRIERMYNE